MLLAVERKRKRPKLIVEKESTPLTSEAELEHWAILESGVLAVKTQLSVVGSDGKHRPTFFDHHNNRLVCKHGWAAARVCAFNTDPSSKPSWTTCDCASACGLSYAKTAPHVAEVAKLNPPAYHDVLKTTPAVKLETGLKAFRLPGVLDKRGNGVFRVIGDPITTLRCKHGNSTRELRMDRSQDQHDAAHLITEAIRRYTRSRRTAAARIRALILMRAYYTEGRWRRRGRKMPRIKCQCTPMNTPRHVLQFHRAKVPNRCEIVSKN